MNLQTILDLNELNRNSYNTLERRTGLAFMKQDLAPGRDKYHYPHAVALGCLLEFLKDGAETQRAASTISNIVADLYPYIRDTIGTIIAGHAPGPRWVHIIRYVDDSLGFASGDAEASDLRRGSSAEIASKQSVNIIAVAKRLVANEGKVGVRTPSETDTVA